MVFHQNHRMNHRIILGIWDSICQFFLQNPHQEDLSFRAPAQDALDPHDLQPSHSTMNTQKKSSKKKWTKSCFAACASVMLPVVSRSTSSYDIFLSGKSWGFQRIAVLSNPLHSTPSQKNPWKLGLQKGCKGIKQAANIWVLNQT